MAQHNTRKYLTYLFYLFLLIAGGCAEQPVHQTVLNEPPPSPITEPYSPVIKDAIQAKKEAAQAKRIKQLIIARKSIWHRLLSLYALPDLNNNRIDQEIQRYLKHPEYLSKIQKRAAPYLYFILDEIETKKIPGELALLPIVESGFNPHAISKSNASGLWQFMPATGRLFGLKQNNWYDGRNDVYTSTQAATSYLKELSELHDDDWLLALASYNAGKGTVGKAIRKNRENKLPTDYWSLKLSNETMTYVPRLLAIAKIFADSEKYNIPLLKIPNKPHFSVVDIKSQVDLKVASELAGIHFNEFITLNPAFKRDSTDPAGPFHLLIDSKKARMFEYKLSRVAKKDRVKPRIYNTRHKVISGENLGIIAEKYQSTVLTIRKNNRLSNNNIRAGQVLLIPISKKKLNNKPKKQLYIVKKGDTFWDIARQFSVRTKDIALWNNLSLSKTLRPGQKLIIKKS